MSSTSELPPPFTPGRFAGRTAVDLAAGDRVDALANVAGIMDAFLPPAEVDDATWDRVFAVNLRASACGVAYTASKHAVNGLTKSTAVFYKGNGIRANVGLLRWA